VWFGNRISMHKTGVVLLYVVGPQDYEHILPITNQIHLIIDSLKRNGKPALLLIDLEHAGVVKPDGILGGVQFLQRVKFDKVAFLKVHGLTKTVMDLILNRANIGQRGQMFEDETEALNWLAYKEEDPEWLRGPGGRDSGTRRSGRLGR